MGRYLPHIQREAPWVILLAVATYTALKGAILTPQIWGQINWFATYEHGFMRRALAGTVFHGLFGDRDPGVYQLAIGYQHQFAIALLVVAQAIALRFAARRSGDYLAIVLGAMIVGASQALPHLAYDVGYLDPHILLLLGLGTAALARRWFWAALAIAALGPLVHEQFVFYWLPIVAVHFALNLAFDGATPTKAIAVNLALAGAAAVTVALVLVFQNHDALRLAIEATPLSPDQQEQLRAQTFELPLPATLTYMAHLWSTYGANGTIAVAAYAVIPGLILCWLAARAFGAAGRSGAVWIILLIGTFGCLSILAVAWDLSRFATMPMLMWVATVLLIGSRIKGGAEPARGRNLGGVIATSLAGVAIAVGLLFPFVFAYFSSVYVIRGPFQPGPSLLEAPAEILFGKAMTP